MYGIMGVGYAPKKVIVASLNDIGNDHTFLVPWYGDVSPGLEIVYDWVLDNNVQFVLVQTKEGKKAPSILRTMAESIVDAINVDEWIAKTLEKEDGIALIMWNEEDMVGSERTAAIAIDRNLPTLELTNGMVPIVFDDSAPQDESVGDADDLMSETDADEVVWTRETLENMPAAVVKRMAQNLGATAKTKEEAIAAVLGEEGHSHTQWEEVKIDRSDRDYNLEFALVDGAPVEPLPYTITIEHDNGQKMTFYGTNEIVKNIVDGIVSEFGRR